MAFLVPGAAPGERISEGYTNWRLPGQQNSLRRNQTMPLRTALLRSRFSASDADGTFGYAEARFLFCYLWMHGLLETYVRDVVYDLRPRYADDPDSSKLLREMIKRLEERTGRSIEELDVELRALALRLGKNQKLERLAPAP